MFGSGVLISAIFALQIAHVRFVMFFELHHFLGLLCAIYVHGSKS